MSDDSRPSRGIVLGVDADTAIIRLASNAEARRFAQGATLAVGAAGSIGYEDVGTIVGADLFVRSRRGEFAQIGMVTSLEVRQDMENITTFGGEAIVIPGLRSATLRFDGHFGG